MDIRDRFVTMGPTRARRFRGLVQGALVFLLVAGPSGSLLAQGGGGEGGDLSLEDLLNLTVSTASKYAQKSTDAPASITIITAEEIQRYGFRSLAEALQMLSSFSIGTDHSYTYTGVRGFARPADYNNRVLVLVDGHTKNENTIGAGEIGGLRLLDIADIERVEVVRGPGSALYGARAMFAVVNIITKRGADIDGTRAWGEMGNFGHRMAGLQVGRLFENGIDLALSGGWGDSDGEDFYFPEFDAPESKNGRAEGLNWGEVMRGRVSIQKGKLRIWGAGYTREKGIPTAPYRSVFGDSRAKTEDERWMLDFQYDKEFTTSLDLTVRTYADHFRTRHSYVHPGENLISLTMEATWAGAEARLKWDVRPDHRLVLGAEYQRTPKAEIGLDDELGLTGFQGDYPYDIGSFFLQDEYQITRNLALTGGVRHDRFSSGGSSTTPRLAMVYHPWNTTTIKALWGMAFRPANIYEKNFETSYGLHLANPELDSEQIRSAEVVLEHRFAGSVAARMSLFRNDVERLIDQKAVLWPEDWPPSSTGSPIILQFQHGDDVRAEGIEMELNGALDAATFVYARYAYQRVETPSTGVRAPNYPSHSVKLGGTRGLRDLVNVGANLIWESGRGTLAGLDADGFALLDLSVSSKLIFEHLLLSVTAKNLLDAGFSLPAGPQHSLVGIPQPRRTLMFRVAVQW